MSKNNKKGSLPINKKPLSVDKLYGKSDVDSFIQKKNKVDLSTIKGKHNNKSKIAEKVDIGLDFSEEEAEDFESEEEDDYEDGIGSESDDEIVEKKTKAKDLDLENKTAWGKDKKLFYSKKTDSKDIGSEDEDEEELEAQQLQEHRNKLIKNDDFQDDDQSFKNLLNKKNKDKSILKPEEKMLQSLNSDLNSINFGDKNSQIEKLEKDISNFTKKEKLQYLITESPLLLDLLEDFKVKMNEVKTSILPALEKVKSNQLPTSKGISFLETKYQLLLSYCLNITYFLMLKSSGVSIKDHPVIDQLIKCRTMIEKIQPLDKKLKYQIDKLLKSANTGTLVGSSKDDPLQHRPNLSSMGGDDDEDEDDEQGLDNDYDDENSRIAQRAGVYQAPKLYGAKGGVIDQEDAIAKKKSKEIRDKQKSIKGKMAKEIEEIYGDKPEEEDDYLDGSGGGSSSRYHGDDEEDDERALKNYEESNYTRVMLSKKEQKAMKSKQKKLSDGLNDLADFSDLTSLMENEDDKEAKENQDYLRKKRMASILNNELGRNKRARSADEDIPLPEKQNKRDFNRSRDDEVESGGESDDDIDSFNNNNKSQEPQYDGIPRTNNFDTSKDFSHKEGDKRKVSKSIEKNRGLTRQRSRENRTPHLRQRNRFEKATKKRSNVIQTAERKDTSYTGTKSINTNSRRAQPYAH
ncbi:U3 snoRNP protein [Dictyostelium discoideum AX4]|uniref:U3 snoRNP protein n=1 Tax=Dictyostelium discoideum TaxID=44689 RepID=Q55CP1_DICDI|nr:U3 snoRNP protein [Dictyostelium discoideum AX4]EAL72336.1 U3 snoRNP protein [Dictyostelium discoideum AX4]|eukprot:XP_646440.1 U3 snoRNP protein [Dictyostelium discoideum AX4]